MLAEPPDVLLLDGTGRDHPRRCGLAVHLGAVLDLPIRWASPIAPSWPTALGRPTRTAPRRRCASTSQPARRSADGSAPEREPVRSRCTPDGAPIRPPQSPSRLRRSTAGVPGSRCASPANSPAELGLPGGESVSQIVPCYHRLSVLRRLARPTAGSPPGRPSEASGLCQPGRRPAGERGRRSVLPLRRWVRSQDFPNRPTNRSPVPSEFIVKLRSRQPFGRELGLLTATSLSPSRTPPVPGSGRR